MTELNSEYKLSLKDCRKIKDFVGLGIEFREVLAHIGHEVDDFETGDYRFISEASIDEVLKEELTDNSYLLGSFAPWILADTLNLDLDLVRLAQVNELQEQLGNSAVKQGAVSELVELLVQLDGYGHYFSSYDGHAHEITGYYCFKVN